MQDFSLNAAKPLQVSSNKQENYHFIVNPEFIKRSSRAFLFNVVGLIGLYILFFNQELANFSWTSCNNLALLVLVIFILNKAYQFYLRAQQVIINQQGIYLYGYFLNASGKFTSWDNISVIGVERDKFSFLRFNYAGHLLTFVSNKKQFSLDDEREVVPYYKNLEADLSLQEAVEKFIDPIEELTTGYLSGLWGNIGRKEKIIKYFIVGISLAWIALLFIIPSTRPYQTLSSYWYYPANWLLAVVMFGWVFWYFRGHTSCFSYSLFMGTIGFIISIQSMDAIPVLLGYPEKNTFMVVEETLNYQLWRSTTDKELYFELSCKVAGRKYAGIGTNTSLPLYRLGFLVSVKSAEMKGKLCDNLS